MVSLHIWDITERQLQNIIAKIFFLTLFCVNPDTIWGCREHIYHVFSSFSWLLYMKGVSLIFEESEFWTYTFV